MQSRSYPFNDPAKAAKGYWKAIGEKKDLRAYNQIKNMDENNPEVLYYKTLATYSFKGKNIFSQPPGEDNNDDYYHIKNNNLFYCYDGKEEIVNINDFKKFLKDIASCTQVNYCQTRVSFNEFYKFMTLNGGHKPRDEYFDGLLKKFNQLALDDSDLFHSLSFKEFDLASQLLTEETKKILQQRQTQLLEILGKYLLDDLSKIVKDYKYGKEDASSETKTTSTISLTKKT